MGKSGGSEAAELSIRGCVATPSRIVLLFEGEPDIAAAQEGANYNVVKVGHADRAYGHARPEYDPQSHVAILRNPISDLELADWLQVTVSGLCPTGQVITHFVRVQSELPLISAGSASSPDRRGSDASKRTTRRRRRWFTTGPAVVVIVTGLVALVALGVTAMVLASTGDMGTIATAAFGVIGSVVSAFFGVHAGLGERERVDGERHVEATKGQMLAAMMPEDRKEAALDMLKEYSPSEPDAGNA